MTVGLPVPAPRVPPSGAVAAGPSSSSGGQVFIVPHQGCQSAHAQQGKGQKREPDSGISSARSTGTVPWSHNEPGLPALQPANRELVGEEEHQL